MSSEALRPPEEETRARLEETNPSAKDLKALSRQIAELVGSYRL
jgi:hypothetical protein